MTHGFPYYHDPPAPSPKVLRFAPPSFRSRPFSV